ncbi:hypothetical protein GQ53DRAFT_818815 [Thozetella sp. PMI_491]|nr:hypothetical protein GQ53DRAFT_818815 [Thozetella sp. PMI_491]
MEYSTDPEVVQQPRHESGLEVAPESGIQPVDKEYLPVAASGPEHMHYPQGLYQDGIQIAYHDAPIPTSTLADEPSTALPTHPWRRKLYLLIGFVLVIVGAVLGGVLGSRAAHQSNSLAGPATTTTTTTEAAAKSSDSTSTSSPTPTPSSIRLNSPLSAVSFHTTEDWSPAGPIVGTVIILAYLGKDGAMMVSIFNSGWQDTPQTLTANSTTQTGTGLAMAGYEIGSMPGNTTSPVYSLELLLIYVNQTGYVNGLKYINTASSDGIQPQDISDRGYSVRANSDVAAYWPWFIFQDWSGDINIAKSIADPPYGSTQIHILAAQQTKFSIVPLSTNYSRVNDSSYGIFYQNPDGKLGAILPGEDTVSLFPNISMPLGAAFSAFSFARSNDTSVDIVTTYVLYQDATSKIKQVWTDDSETWKQASPSVLAKADNGTDISCLTPSSMNNTYGPAFEVAG